jgi:purine-cytosine permease-like protein
MQTAEQVGKDVPIREGDYGEKVATIEPGGVEYIALRERHGKPIDLFWTWLSPNLEFATVFIGVIAVAFEGLNLWQAATAILLGTGLGSISHAVLSSFGPKFGVPMMIVSRGPFGFLGNILPAALNGLTASFGWFIVNSVSGAFALQSLFPNFNLPFWLAFLVIVVAQVVIATLGHNLIHVFERVAVPLLGVVFIVACFYIFTRGNYGFSPKPVPGGWFLAFTAAFGYAVGWNPFAADYTRYMSPTVNRRMVGFWAGFGVFLSCVVLEMAGAVLVTVSGTDFFNGIPTAQLQKAMTDPVYYAALL